MDPLPKELDVERHVLLRGRKAHPWFRRALFCVPVAIPVLALFNVFGQRPSTSQASSPVATLRVQAPKRVRGGLLFQLRVEVDATHDIKEPQIVLSPGWFEQLTINTTAPDPVSQNSSNGRVVLSYGRIPAGQKLTVWVQYQTNAANLGTQTANVALTDGATPIASVKRNITIFP